MLYPTQIVSSLWFLSVLIWFGFSNSHLKYLVMVCCIAQILPYILLHFVLILTN
jgi:hypothetical protein